MNTYQKNYFNFKKFGNRYLLTNDFGNYAFLSEKNFKAVLKNEKLSKKQYEELVNKQFIYLEETQEFVKNHFQKLKEYKEYLESSTVLHIFVVSKNCNYRCIYCQAGELNQKEEQLMSKETAQKAVDIAFESPAHFLTFEFQGGEPLTNFEVIQFIIEYSKQKNSEIKNHKEIEYQVVSNLSLLTEKMILYFRENNVSVCTSIDGNKALQNQNRPYPGYDSYEATIQNFQKLKQKGVNVSALLTTSKFSLNKYKSIVDEYVRLGLNIITVRPLTMLGKAAWNFDKIGYSPEEFLTFYRRILKYIIQKNQKGIFLVEGIASILLSKIFNGKSPNYMELRSPCGAAIGQLAYYYDGNIYTCDEGRMLAEMGDNKFCLGNVFQSHYDNLIQNECTKEMCHASCLESASCCHSCVYMPYCGTCPVVNYAKTGEMVLTHKNDYKCQIMSGILDTLFTYIEKDKSALRVFQSWL